MQILNLEKRGNIQHPTISQTQHRTYNLFQIDETPITSTISHRTTNTDLTLID